MIYNSDLLCKIFWGVDSCCINIWCHLQKKQSLLSVFAKLLYALLTQARESHMRSEKMESFIFIPGKSSWQNNNGFTIPHVQSEHSFLNQLAVVILAIRGEKKSVGYVISLGLSHMKFQLWKSRWCWRSWLSPRPWPVSFVIKPVFTGQSTRL